MKKRLIAFFLICIMSISMMGCNTGNDSLKEMDTSASVLTSASVTTEVSTSVSEEPVASISVEPEPEGSASKSETRQVEVYFMNGSPENIVIATINPETKEQEVIDCVIKPGEAIKYTITDWKDEYEVFVFAVYNSNYEFTSTYYFDMTGITSYIQLLLGGEEKCDNCSIYGSQ